MRRIFHDESGKKHSRYSVLWNGPCLCCVQKRKHWQLNFYKQVNSELQLYIQLQYIAIALANKCPFLGWTCPHPGTRKQWAIWVDPRVPLTLTSYHDAPLTAHVPQSTSSVASSCMTFSFKINFFKSTTEQQARPLSISLYHSQKVSRSSL